MGRFTNKEAEANYLGESLNMISEIYGVSVDPKTLIF